MFVNPFQLMQMAKEDVKLAWLMFNHGQKKMLEHRAAEAQQNQQATFEAQIQSAKAAEEEKRLTEQMKIDGDIKKTQETGQAQNRTSVINMVTSWLAPSADGTIGKVPPEYQPLVQAVIQNVMVSAIAATEEQKQQIIAKMQEAEMAAQQQAQAQQEQEQGPQPEQNQQQQVAA